MVVETDDIILVWNNPVNAVAIVKLSLPTFRKMIPKFLRATGYNIFVIPLATSALYARGILFTPAIGMTLMVTSAVIVATDMSFLKSNNTIKTRIN
jgi:Cu2+-exporting ATPase